MTYPRTPNGSGPPDTSELTDQPETLQPELGVSVWPPVSADERPQPSAGGRGWVAGLAAVVAVIAVTAALVTSRGGHHAVAGTATPATDARTVAQTFANLEFERYNGGTPDQPPQPAAAAYADVSCARDLAQMRDNGARPAPLNRAHRYVTVVIRSITAASKGRQLLRLARTTLATGHLDDSVFTLQRESSRWVVCGLYPATAPRDPDTPVAPPS